MVAVGKMLMARVVEGGTGKDRPFVLLTLPHTPTYTDTHTRTYTERLILLPFFSTDIRTHTERRIVLSPFFILIHIHTHRAPHFASFSPLLLQRVTEREISSFCCLYLLYMLTQAMLCACVCVYVEEKGKQCVYVSFF